MVKSQSLTGWNLASGITRVLRDVDLDWIEVHLQEVGLNRVDGTAQVLKSYVCGDGHGDRDFLRFILATDLVSLPFREVCDLF